MFWALLWPIQVSFQVQVGPKMGDLWLKYSQNDRMPYWAKKSTWKLDNGPKHFDHHHRCCINALPQDCTLDTRHATINQRTLMCIIWRTYNIQVQTSAHCTKCTCHHKSQNIGITCLEWPCTAMYILCSVHCAILYTSSTLQVHCKWHHLVAKFSTNASGTIRWPNLELLQVAPSCGQILN